MIPHDKIPYYAPGRFVHDDSWKYNRPPQGCRLDIMTEDEKGPYVIPYPVLYDGHSFINPTTHEYLEIDVKAWRKRQRRH